MTGGVSPLLRRLAADRATGALVRDLGTLHLVDGQVVHAESPVAPGLDVLLAGGSDRLSAARAHGVRAVRTGAGEREICRLGALFDAAFFALAPGRGPARFRYGADPRHAGAGRPVPAAAVERETLRRRELLDSVWPYPALDTAPVVPRPAAPGQSVTARGRALLARADGVRTPAQLAWILGRPAFHTLLEVRRLAAAGLVETPLPDPAPGAGPGSAPVPPGAAPAAGPPDIALLRRVRDALEARL
ncbi:transcriptional regulator [Streptomyces sp. TRM76323]|uniref:Transcriptional regulator n=1 Tax=Streptomyces tamarix TaxID=3078565 RepID=A0ABU3QPR3_9ACTN|nr:transcriptional regulator [Streptomyces tamarix]MDT9684743.1 transcriptional regulator [Streptomyces tamarix]